MKTIGTGAFIDLPNLTKLFLRAQTPPKWEYNDVFCFHSGGIGDANAYTTDNTILYVPEGCVHTYETTVFSNRSLGWTTACGWDYFTHIKSIVDYAPEAYAVYADGITQDGTFYAGDLERVSMSIAGVEGYDFSINSFVAKFNPMDVGVNHSMVYLGSDNKLYYSNGNMRVNACRAYFVLNGIFANEKGDGINNFVLNFDNGQTGISSSMVEGSGCSDETWYSMDGRKLNAKPKAKGVYVSHGKKIFIK